MKKPNKLTKVMFFPSAILILGMIFTPFVFNNFSIGTNPDAPMLIYVFSVLAAVIISIYVASNIIFGEWKRKK
jgi:hypothetical protein